MLCFKDSNIGLCVFVCLWCFTGGGGGGGGGGAVISDAEIKAVSEALYALDSNKASASELIIDPQALVPDSQTSSKIDLSSVPWEHMSHYHSTLIGLILMYLPPFSCVICHLCLCFVLPACSATWMRQLCSQGPPTLLSWLCWTTTTGWPDRQKTSALSSWLSRKPSSRRPCPTLSWAESCLPSSTPRVTGLSCNSQ